MLSVPPILSQVAMGENMREADNVRCVANKQRYESFYSAWDVESPANLNQQFSTELRAAL